jgi:hypothetical protein
LLPVAEFLARGKRAPLEVQVEVVEVGAAVTLHEPTVEAVDPRDQRRPARHDEEEPAGRRDEQTGGEQARRG